MEMPAIFLVGLFCVLFNDGTEVDASQPEFQNFQSCNLMVNESQPYRTSYHFQPPKNWLNGPMLYKGLYHLFYQYNPNSALFGDGMVWAHSVSYDLINWVHLNHALHPTEPFDIKSCWSGSVTILPGNKPVILYTGIDANNTQVQNLAMPKNLSDPLLKEWIKFSQNPVITPPIGIEGDHFRDPTTAWLGADGKWNVIIGSSINDQGMAILYQSDDFVNWSRYQDPLYSKEKTGMWECPDFFPVSVNSTNGVDTSVINPGVKHVMKASFNSHDYYMIGTYVPGMEKYIPDTDFTGSNTDLRYDYGKFYASKTFFDSVKDRRILWGWINESDSAEDDINKGWSGLQSIPRQVWLDRSGSQLVLWPVEEINKLHDKQVSIQHKKLDGGSVLEIPDITASQADVEVLFELPELEEAELLNSTWVDPQKMCTDANAAVRGRLGPFGLLALATEDLTEQTAIFFRIFRGHNAYTVLMCSDQSRSSLKEKVDKTTYGAFVNIDPQHEKISLRSLIDHSIIESFGGEGRTCISSRVYPQLAVHKEAHLYVFNNGTQSITISKLNAWGMSKAQFIYEENCFSYKASQ
ncbi:beta-fructofuranosidase, insoluble isoenzyme CWINV1 isoform X2 [Hevea brasiliensis]|uniref:beta-fructofuranosidase, insoluble isoenzyme CWINV1 isoform X2 n=1 Tax=Hevea brasiliensis TaxID=3981 RepID=UPI0025E8973A|nr:beta-fructofuranosidase, insoluble isoenzyme CWINV1 isoform X2 [Hevea brasiliensis]